MDIKVPQVGESIFEAVIASWHKQDGAFVEKDEMICELETDKVNVELNAEASGTLHILEPQGQTVKIGASIGRIDEGAAPEKAAKAPTAEKAAPEKTAAAQAPPKAEAPVNPAARKLAREKGIEPSAVSGTGRDGRVTLEDVQQSAAAAPKTPAPAPSEPPPPAPAAPAAETAAPGAERVTRQPMSPLRKKVAERLVAVGQQAAMLTTFNEADMSAVLGLRSRQQEHFQKKHGVKLGLMSFFVKACVEALKEFPGLNARIDGDDIVHQHFYDIGIAVGSEKGLVVPVLRDADGLTFAAIEKAIGEMAQRVKERRITLAELEGGTFTISNGGVYGSLLSTPMLNLPQCGVLGMHAIVERPVARDGQVVIRPMMNLALSYDHRLIDGREAVSFLKRIKDCIEEPEEMLLEL